MCCGTWLLCCLTVFAGLIFGWHVCVSLVAVGCFCDLVCACLVICCFVAFLLVCLLDCVVGGVGGYYFFV